MEALADAIGLRAPGFGAGVVDVLDGQVELVLVALAATEFGAAIGEHAAELDLEYPMNQLALELPEAGALVSRLQPLCRWSPALRLPGFKAIQAKKWSGKKIDPADPTRR